MKKYIFLSIVIMTNIPRLFSQEVDPYIWLEDVDGTKALEFVTKYNTSSIEKLSREKNYQTIYDKSLDIYNSTDRIANPSIEGTHVYNFWQDKIHERGIWRRTSKESYLTENPSWEILLDLDEMYKKDGVKWVFKGSTGLYPKYDRYLISLSKGGGDAVVTREFDVKTKSFIENGFYIDESKGGASFYDENTLIVSSDFGEGTLTSSGYPRQVKLWKRGTLLKDAQLIHEGVISDVSTSGYKLYDGDKSYFIVSQGTTFYTNKYFIWINNQLTKLKIPEDADFSTILNDQLIITLKSDWKIGSTIFKQGSIVSANFTSLIKGITDVKLVYEPDEFSSISDITTTKNKLLINVLTNVKNELYIYTLESQKWVKSRVNAPDFGTINVGSTDELSDEYFFYFQNFLTPSSLYFADANTNTFKIIKSLSAYFDGTKYKVEQFKAKSKDGTMIPYFVVSLKSVLYNGQNPTLLYGYGGFEISLAPSYSGTLGNAWLENGGVYVLSNIRGGGEFGPKWHQAGLKDKRQNVYNDFYAIAEELISKKITSPKHLGIMGGSNGGLLVGVAFTQRPDLFNAVICAVPLLDMKRFNKLLAGASWMGEYGNPDIPEEWTFIQKFSPYHNLKKGVKYPEVFFTTSTRDDRVHPAHARKMVARMEEMGYPVYYYENLEGGHAGASTNDQRAKLAALQYSYLLMKLKD